MIQETWTYPRLYRVSFTYDWTTVSLAVMAHSDDEASQTAEDIAADEWGTGVRQWSDVQLEIID